MLHHILALLFLALPVALSPAVAQHALRDAVYQGDLDRVRALLPSGDVNAKDDRGVGLLWYAAQEGHDDVVEFLLRNNADANITTPSRATPLHIASGKGFIGIAELLLGAGADVSSQNQQGVTPLHWAVENGKIRMARLLLDRGANIDAADERGWTPLHWAIENGYSATANVLLEMGADAAAATNDGRTPMQLALEERRAVAAAAVRAHGGRLANRAEVVKFVELQLWQRGYGVARSDTVADSISTEATRMYQREAGLNVDGRMTVALVNSLVSTGQFNVNVGAGSVVRTNVYVGNYRLAEVFGWDRRGVSTRGALGEVSLASGARTCSIPEGLSRTLGCWRSSDLQFGNMQVNGSVLVLRSGFIFFHGSAVTIER